jgi:hypothetical protein
MAFLGISGMQYSGETFPDVRIIVAEDSNVFTSMISTRMRELFGMNVEICRTFEDAPRASYRKKLRWRSPSSCPARRGAQRLVDRTSWSSLRHVPEQTAKAARQDIIGYIPGQYFAVEMLWSVCRF